MRFTPVSVCANTYQRPSSSAKLRKYDSPFTSNCNFNLPLVRKNKPRKNKPRISRIVTDVLDFLSVMIRVNPWPSSFNFLFLVFDVYILGVDDSFVLLGVTIGRGSRSSAGSCLRTRSRRALRLCRFVHVLSQLVRGLGQRLAGFVHGCLVAAFQRLLGVGNRVFDITTFRAGDLVALLAQHLLDSIHHGIELILGIDRFALGL